jgi:hypothetical protein
MKLLVLASLLVAAPAFADDPSTGPGPTMFVDEPGTPGENLPPAPPPPPEQAPAPKARMTQPLPHARSRDKDDDDGRLEKREDTVAGGTHWRIKTREGAIHVWIPAGYDRATAGTVVYVHGYYVDVDTAWREYNLARQFRASRQNAMFIVPEAPSGNDEAVNWPALKDLRRAIARANIKLPDGPIIVMGHSGAFRTIMQWVDHRLIEQIILLDAMYAGERQFDEYIGTGKRADQHKLIVVGASTAQESASFAHRYKFAATREKMPSSVSGFTRHQRNARLLYVRAQYDHMAIVTSGKVIPTLLHLTPLKAL